MPRKHNARLLLVVSLLLVAAAALVLTSCSREGSISSPTSSGGSNVASALSAHNPNDVALAMRVQNAHTPELMKIPDVVGTGTSVGAREDAPGRYDGKPRCAVTPQCGTLSQFVRINFGGNNTIDCAIAQMDTGNPTSVVQSGGYTATSSVQAASVGLAVKKSGRTSGLTHGTVQAINVTITVGYSTGTATFSGQIMTPATFIRAGDSGSLMVTETGNNPVGLCFAGGSGGSFANPIGPVLQAFGATVATQ